ncbi:hypothetical protein [Streptomyces sp. NPDC056660]|uniref:hypothetical protein n=1 Tax=Streptomyces sp. NPDC056660 TaxID=3345897 RepID=UPI003680298A
MATGGEHITQLVTDLKSGYLGLSMALVPLIDPAIPLLPIFDRYGLPPEAPVIVRRQDNTVYSSQSLQEVLTAATAVPGAGMRGDLLAFVIMHGMTRIGDAIDQAGLRDPSNATLELARHLRNACAHGNRWHFRPGEPRYPATLRGRSIDAGLHGTRAVNGWLGPGDYLDLLDDLAAHFQPSVSNSDA